MTKLLAPLALAGLLGGCASPCRHIDAAWHHMAAPVKLQIMLVNQGSTSASISRVALNGMPPKDLAFKLAPGELTLLSSLQLVPETVDPLASPRVSCLLPVRIQLTCGTDQYDARLRPKNAMPSALSDTWLEDCTRWHRP